MVAALKPIHDAANIKRLVVSTYQSVSGTGAAAIQELEYVDANINIFEWLTMMSYAAGGYGWSLDEEHPNNKIRAKMQVLQ